MRPPENEGAYSVEVWLEYAEMDLGVAEAIVARPQFTPAACFHAQQAAETRLR